MKKFAAIITVLFITVPASAQLFPQLGGQRAGISTAQFLKIGVGGRAAALGESFVALSNDASSLYWNPAGVIQSGKNEIIFSHNEWVVDIKHDFAGVVYNLSANDAVGVAVTALHMADMEKTTEVMPFGTGEYFSVGSFAVGLTYSRKMTDKFSFGGTIKYIEETLAELKMRGVMVDLGTYYWTGLGTTRFAVAITNFGNELAPDGEVILFGGRKQSNWKSFSPPTMFRIGFAMEPWQTDRHRLTTSIQLNHPNDNNENVGLGVEYAWNKMIFLRGGYKFNVDEQNYSFGAGFNIPASIALITLDYAYANFDRLGSAHRFSLIFSL